MDQVEPQIKDNSQSFKSLYPGYFLFLLLIGAMILGNMLSSLFIIVLDNITGQNSMQLLSGSSAIDTPQDRNYIRWISAIGHICTFLIPALITVLIYYRQQWVSAIKLKSIPHWFNLLMGSLFLLLAFPLVQLSYWLNQQLPLPDWITQMENKANELINAITLMDSPQELLLNLFVIAVIPAIGEELVFRGIIQQKLQESIRLDWIAIWLTAILFSAFHFQFAGFLPRLILGAGLGYIFYWTNSLWVPIVAHAFVNGSQIVGKYYLDGEIEDVALEENLQTFGPTFVIATLVCIGIGYTLIKTNARVFNNTGEKKDA